MAVLLVSYNGAQFLPRCLASLLSQVPPPGRVLVIDNGSTDDTVALVRQAFPQVETVALGRNLGFGAANNIGIEKALAAGAENIFLLNQDMVLRDGVVEFLGRAMADHPDYGLVSAFHLTYDGATLDRLFRWHLPTHVVDDLYFGRLQDVYETPFVPAAAVLLRADALRAVGGFDPLFFLYHEDDDLCRRLRLDGWKLGLVPRAQVQHWHGQLNARPSLGWLCNWEYSEAVHLLKSSHRAFPVAYLVLLKRWLTPGPLNLKRGLARVWAYVRCVANARTIYRHRNGIPYVFRESSPSAESTPAQRAHARAL
jgi:GT2 family glycosyltransferase